MPVRSLWQNEIPRKDEGFARLPAQFPHKLFASLSHICVLIVLVYKTDMTFVCISVAEEAVKYSFVLWLYKFVKIKIFLAYICLYTSAYTFNFVKFQITYGV